MNPSSHHSSSQPDGDGRWPSQADMDSKGPIQASPVPQAFVSVPVTSTRCAGSQPVFGLAPAPVAEQMNNPNVHLGRVGVTQYPQPQYGWIQHPNGLITATGITPPATPPGVVYDTLGRSSGLPVQPHAHAHAHRPQGQRWPCLYVHPSHNHTNLVYLSHPQSEKDLLAQHYARLSLADTEKSAKCPIPVTTVVPGTAPATTTTEVPAQQSQVVRETTATGATGLTVTTTTTGTTGTTGTTTRTITGPDGTVLVPPPTPAHPGCELSPHMAKAMEDYAIPHCCDYMQAKNLLRDKIVKKVLENTQEKLMELLQNELDRMSSEEEDDDCDIDLDSDMEDGETGQDAEDWTLEG